jgi:hypothetical protein
MTDMVVDIEKAPVLAHRQEIESINVYRESSEFYSFPTRRQCELMVPDEYFNVGFVHVPNYAMSQRYPLLVAAKRSD